MFGDSRPNDSLMFVLMQLGSDIFVFWSMNNTLIEIINRRVVLKSVRQVLLSFQNNVTIYMQYFKILLISLYKNTFNHGIL